MNLLPCPFCGAEAYVDSVWGGGISETHQVRCKECDARSGTYSTKISVPGGVDNSSAGIEYVVKLWNIRK